MLYYVGKYNRGNLMTDKELKKLRRADLLRMLLDATKEIAELNAQNLKNEIEILE